MIRHLDFPSKVSKSTGGFSKIPLLTRGAPNQEGCWKNNKQLFQERQIVQLTTIKYNIY